MNRFHQLCCGIFVGVLFVSSVFGFFNAPTALAAGFEVGENTPRSLARGGTGAVNTQDPTALYFNPALLTHAAGTQVQLSANILHLDLEFQRDDFYLDPNGDPTHVFDPARNQTGLFPIPFGTVSLDIGPENLTLGAGVFGPPAYGNPCYGTIEDGECRPDRLGATRGMVVETDMVVAYAGVGAGYAFEFGDDRRLDIGLTLAGAYQTSDFSVVVDADFDIAPPRREDPENEAFVRGENLSDIAPTGIIGVAFTDGPLRIAASYRPPIRWTLEGTTAVDFPEILEDQEATLTADGFTLETWHAGSLRFGWGLQGGEHPADPNRPRWDFEMNTVWENWSLVDDFRVELEGDIEVQAIGPQGGHPTYTLNPIYQPKGYQDTFSLRTGFSAGLNSWLTAHSGGFLETAAQPLAYTTADFISWERYAASLGATLHLPANLQLDLAYSFIYSPPRTVTDGAVYNPIPLSGCSGPDFDSDACERPGRPPGNPQNEGEWNSSVQIFGAGLVWKY